MKKLMKFVLFIIFCIVLYGVIEIIADRGAKSALTVTPSPSSQTSQPGEFTLMTPEITITPVEIEPASLVTDRDWNSILTLPTLAEIHACNSSSSSRSPYIGGWMSTEGVSYTAYSVEFKADFLPNATYCCPANFDLDYSWLKDQYADVRTEYSGVAGYAGFQKQSNGNMNAILSFWDVFCTDTSGNQTVIRAELVYPTNASSGSFGGEGTGAHYLSDYQWQAGRWYRMQLLCEISDTTGNTTIEQWVEDLETEEQTLLCIYDLGVPNVCFKGDIAVFLENFDPAYAGDVRTMECRNFKILDQYGQLINLTSGYYSESFEYPGRFQYGSEGDCIFMITTGAGSSSQSNPEPQTLTIYG